MRNFNDIREGTNEASVDLLRKKLKKIKKQLGVALFL